MKNRVVITGMGVVSPIGSNISDFAKSLCNGDSGISYSQELERKILSAGSLAFQSRFSIMI
ncbi:MAG: hypothetical protein II554_05435 [Bacteroidales bacterium]|nr:hypothetical protein [Bacteroidales bacterium]